jgi:hypothetical protein
VPCQIATFAVASHHTEGMQVAGEVVDRVCVTAKADPGADLSRPLWVIVAKVFPVDIARVYPDGLETWSLTQEGKHSIAERCVCLRGFTSSLCTSTLR